ncbi:four helix bundle protein [bacterium (Candidatus Howlettbacteria) CG_4_10_14_0_8_um_filter_40_9]|nr:MAG: four helix bundle protein [bacterium (Candidatus Howlettbacteria) CG_4_10_14_0_8_um_filter_40_9]
MKNDNANFKSDFKKRIYVFAIRLIRFIESLPRTEVSRVLGKQLLRSGTSVLANYIEAQAASSRKDFTNFFHHSLKSANESKMWLSLLKDTGKGNKEEVEYLIKELTEISNVIASSIITLKGKR